MYKRQLLEAKKRWRLLYAVGVLSVADNKLSCWGASMNRIVRDVVFHSQKKEQETTNVYYSYGSS